MFFCITEENQKTMLRACLARFNFIAESTFLVFSSKSSSTGEAEGLLVVSHFLPNQNIGKVKRFGTQLVWCQNFGNTFQFFLVRQE
jgi:hypothetical protein